MGNEKELHPIEDTGKNPDQLLATEYNQATERLLSNFPSEKVLDFEKLHNAFMARFGQLIWQHTIKAPVPHYEFKKIEKHIAVLGSIDFEKEYADGWVPVANYPSGDANYTFLFQRVKQ